MIQVLRETHETPRDVARRVARVGGANRFGEPNYRVAWGWNRLTWIGGKWTLFDSHGNATGARIELRREPKYVPIERWHVERWMPPESYGSPEFWRLSTSEEEDGIRIAALGPYPARGDWEHVFTLEGPSGEFIPLNALAVEYVVRAVIWADQQPARAKRLAQMDRQIREDRAADARDAGLIDAAFARPRGQETVTVA